MPPCSRHCPATLEQLLAQGRARLEAAGDSLEDLAVEVQLELRLPGSEQGLRLSWPNDLAGLRRGFIAAHQRRFGYVPGGTASASREKPQICP